MDQLIKVSLRGKGLEDWEQEVLERSMQIKNLKIFSLKGERKHFRLTGCTAALATIQFCYSNAKAATDNM